MNVVRARRVVVCFLAVLLLFSVTVSAADSTVALDTNQYNGLISNISSIYDILSRIFIDVGVIAEDTGKLVSAFSTDRTDFSVADMIYDIHFASIASQGHLNGMSTNVNYIVSLLQDGSIGTIGTVLSDIKTSNSSISTSAAAIDLDFDTANSLLTNIRANVKDINDSTSNLDFNFGLLLSPAWNLSSYKASFFYKVYHDLHDLHEIYSSEEDLELKQSQVEEQEAFISGFGSVDRAGDISDMSGLRSGLTDWFSLPDVDISSTFEQVESGYSSWFSSETAQALTVGAGASSFSGVSLMDDTYVEPETPYLDDYDRQVQDILAGGDGEW